MSEPILSREEFEAWASSEGIDTRCSVHHDDVYAYPAARTAWRGWQAARRTTPDREALVEECAKVAEQRSLMLPSDSDMTRGYANGRLGAASDIRALKTATTTSLRDTIVEEIADTIDHMGEGRRLEEYVEAIRTFKSAPSRALDRLAENAQELGLDYMTAPTAASREKGNG
ncbi:hypothetical protein WJ85_17355 [Burkholderia ubonensis]|uniref:hypothetical protein n=1 Tax=Burkholderia ubonensis TaxID=101571 RepID=UPI00075A2C06|nr:hypothetical protein [Burkholderia ubonensis]KVP11996.1 hypothetical protein WJ85_17355 [Burkholderia ubonensis]